MTVDDGLIRALAVGEGEQLRIGAFQLTIKVTAAATQGAYCMVETLVAPRLLSPPHEHVADDQLVYVLAGTIGFRTGDEEHVAGPGGSVFRPRKVPHALWNPTDEPARIIEITSPGTIETYFLEADALTRAGGADGEAIRRLGEQHGQVPVAGWSNELFDAHGVSLSGASSSGSEIVAED